MSHLIPRLLRRARNLLQRLGVQPPYWLIRLGRHLHGKYSQPPAFNAHALADPQSLARLEAKIDRLLWQNERIEATLYLQSLQAADVFDQGAQAPSATPPSAHSSQHA